MSGGRGAWEVRTITQKISQSKGSTVSFTGNQLSKDLQCYSFRAALWVSQQHQFGGVEWEESCAFLLIFFVSADVFLPGSQVRPASCTGISLGIQGLISQGQSGGAEEGYPVPLMAGASARTVGNVHRCLAAITRKARAKLYLL